MLHFTRGVNHYAPRPSGSGVRHGLDHQFGPRKGRAMSRTICHTRWTRRRRHPRARKFRGGTMRWSPNGRLVIERLGDGIVRSFINLIPVFASTIRPHVHGIPGIASLIRRPRYECTGLQGARNGRSRYRCIRSSTRSPYPAAQMTLPVRIERASSARQFSHHFRFILKFITWSPMTSGCRAESFVFVFRPHLPNEFRIRGGLDDAVELGAIVAH